MIALSIFTFRKLLGLLLRVQPLVLKDSRLCHRLLPAKECFQLLCFYCVKYVFICTKIKIVLHLLMKNRNLRFLIKEKHAV